jgi:hypothetical protein
MWEVDDGNEFVPIADWEGGENGISSTVGLEVVAILDEWNDVGDVLNEFKISVD